MELDLTFAHNYTIRTDVSMPDDPESIPVHYYPDRGAENRVEGVWLEITPKAGQPWRGMFEPTYHGIWPSGAYACPNGKSICVVAGGRCYFVKSDAPEHWRDGNITITVKVLPEHNILILQHPTSFTAYGKFGYMWTTSYIATMKELVVESISGESLYCSAEFYVDRDKGYVRSNFEINLVTGDHKGTLASWTPPYLGLR